MDEVRGTGYLASPVLNHPMTSGFCIDSRNTRMSKHVKRCHLSKWSAMSSNGNLSSSAKLRGFWSAFWDGRTYATLYGMSHCHTTHLDRRAWRCMADLRREGIGAAAHFESSEAWFDSQ